MRLADLRANMAPNFITPAGNPDLTIVGTSNYSPAAHPVTLVSSLPNGSVGYERLFADVAPDGSPVAYYHPGTFGMLVPAGRGYRG